MRMGAPNRLDSDIELLGLMVSGGSDSMAMLHMAAQGELDCVGDQTQLVVIHVNHHLRDTQTPWALRQASVCYEGFDEKHQQRIELPSYANVQSQERVSSSPQQDLPDNDLDAQLVKEVADRLHIPCYVLDVDVVSAYRHRPAASLEDVARRLRYQAAFDCLDKLCADQGINVERAWLATAHTASDRAETLMMRLMNGSSPAGLSARLDGRARVLRPLQHATRAELRAYLTDRRLTWREDETNFDTAYLRAFVRHELMPQMRLRNPAVEEALVRTARLLQSEHEYLQQQADELRNTVVLHADEHEVVFNPYELISQPVALVRRIVLGEAQALAGESCRMTSDAVESIIQAGHQYVQGDEAPQPRMLVGALDMRSDRDGIVLSCGRHDHTPRQRSAHTLQHNQAVSLQMVELPAGMDPDEFARLHTVEGVCSVIDADRIGLHIPQNAQHITLRAGDELSVMQGVLGIDSVWGDLEPFLQVCGHKKTRQIVAEAGIPARLTSWVPVVFLQTAECVCGDGCSDALQASDMGAKQGMKRHPICLPGIRVASEFACTKETRRVVELRVHTPYDAALLRSKQLKIQRHTH